MSRHIAESRSNLVEHDNICFDSSWVPWVTGSCAAVRSGYKLTNTTKCTRQKNSEMKHKTTMSNPMMEMKLSGKIERNVPESALKAECTKSSKCREIFVEPRGNLLSEIKRSWRSQEKVKEPYSRKSKRSAKEDKPINENGVNCRKTLRDDTDKSVDKQNCTNRSKKHSSKLPSVSELEYSCPSFSDCASTSRSFTVSIKSAANYFLKQQSPGPFKDRVNGKMHFNYSKNLSETDGVTDMFSVSYPDNDSSHSLLKFYRSTSDSGDSSGNGLTKIKDKGKNKKNMRYNKERVLDKKQRANGKCLQDTTLKLASINSTVNGKRYDKQMSGSTCNGRGKRIEGVGDGGNSELLQEDVKMCPILRPHSTNLSEKGTTVSKKKKSFRAEGGKSAYPLGYGGEGCNLRGSAKEEKLNGVQMSRSVELGIDVLLFAISRFKNIVKRCSKDLPTEGVEGDKEEVLERCVNELSSKLKNVHDNTTRLLVEVEEQPSLGNSCEAVRPTTSAKQEPVECRINNKHFYEHKRKSHSACRPNTCFPSRTNRQYSPDTSTLIQQTKGR